MRPAKSADLRGTARMADTGGSNRCTCQRHPAHHVAGRQSCRYCWLRARDLNPSPAQVTVGESRPTNHRVLKRPLQDQGTWEQLGSNYARTPGNRESRADQQARRVNNLGAQAVGVVRRAAGQAARRADDAIRHHRRLPAHRGKNHLGRTATVTLLPERRCSWRRSATRIRSFGAGETRAHTVDCSPGRPAQHTAV